MRHQSEPSPPPGVPPVPSREACLSRTWKPSHGRDSSTLCQVESQVLIAKLSEQDNPYAIIADWVSGGIPGCIVSGMKLLSAGCDQR